MLAALVGTAVLAGPAAANADSARAVGIGSISPSVADRGGVVSITGDGFGGPNVRITVGGIAAEVISAAGSEASFRVPALAGPGRVLVRATNPGGRVGEIGLTVVFDGHTVAVADEAAAVAEPVGSDGGTIAVAGMSLAIPAGAVPEGTTITATPLRSLRGSPFAAAPVGLKLEPSGLVLLRPATLTLPRPSGTGQLVGFGFNGDGEGLHLLPHRIVGEAVELKVWHFSGAGVLTARLDELEAALSYEPTPAHELAEQRIAAALVDAQVNGSNPGPAVAVALRNWRTSSVSQGLQIAGTESRLDFFELAFGEWLAWLAYLQEYRDTLAPAESSFFDTASALDRNTATDSASAVARRQLERCVGPDLPRTALRNVIRIASAVNLADLPIEGGEAGEQPLPAGSNLPSACVDVEITAIEHAAAFARNRANLFKVEAQVVFWSGDPSTTIPLRYRLAGIATEVTSNGRYSLTRRPADLGTDDLQLTVDLDTTGTDTVLRTIFEQRQLSIPVRERLELHARRSGDSFTDTPGTVGAGGTVTLRIRLAGDTIDAQPITLTHDGTGTLPATATTNASGEALVTYTAPATTTTELSELVTATITDNGLTTGDAIVITTRPTITISVTPSFAFVNTGGSVQFSATVTGTSDQRVSWNATVGSISSTGRYTAGTTPGIFNVTATSIADPSVSASAFVQVTGGSFAGFWSGTVTDRSGFDLGSVRIQVLATPTLVTWFGLPVSFTTPGRFVLRVLEPHCGTGTLFLAEVELAEGVTFTADPGFFGCFPGTRLTGTVSEGSMRFELLSPVLFDGSRALIFTYTLTRE